LQALANFLRKNALFLRKMHFFYENAKKLSNNINYLQLFFIKKYSAFFNHFNNLQAKKEQKT